MLETISLSAHYLKTNTGLAPDVAIILGTGSGAFVKDLEISHTFPFENIPGFVKSTVEGHNGKLIFARLGNQNLVIMQGRLHFYEGFSMQQVTFPVRVFKQMGVKYLFLSNAAGGLNPEYETGDLMVLEDHINLMPNPLIGPHYDALGERFPDMSEPYDRNILRIAERIAKENLIRIRKGCYVGVTGPTFETPAEYRFLRTIGGDAVGMSTIPEVIVARQAGIRCFAVSIITDLGIPGKIEELHHQDVLKIAETAEPQVSFLLKSLVKAL